MLFNVHGLGVAWYTSSNADFERGNTVSFNTPKRPLMKLRKPF